MEDTKKKTKKLSEVAELVAVAMNVEVLDEQVFQRRVNQALADTLVPLMYSAELERKGVTRRANGPDK